MIFTNKDFSEQANDSSLILVILDQIWDIFDSFPVCLGFIPELVVPIRISMIKACCQQGSY
jgi:hypothetical protein